MKNYMLKMNIEYIEIVNNNKNEENQGAFAFDFWKNLKKYTECDLYWILYSSPKSVWADNWWIMVDMSTNVLSFSKTVDRKILKPYWKIYRINFTNNSLLSWSIDSRYWRCLSSKLRVIVSFYLSCQLLPILFGHYFIVLW